MTKVTEVTCDFSLRTERAKKACYSGLKEKLDVLIHHEFGRKEPIVMTWNCKGQNRDVYVGQSFFINKIVIKIHSALYNSNGRELMLLEKGFAEFAVPVLYHGNLRHEEKEYSFVMEEYVPTVAALFRTLCLEKPSGKTIREFCYIFMKTIQLWRDITTAGFNFLDLGPHNLGYVQADNEGDLKVLCIDWEHSVEGRTPRKTWNLMFKRLVTDAAASMATNPQWGSIGTHLVTMAKNDWWMKISDETLWGDDQRWLINGIYNLHWRMTELWEATKPPEILTTIKEELDSSSGDDMDSSYSHSVPLDEDEPTTTSAHSDSLDEEQRSQLLNNIKRLYECFRPSKLRDWDELVTKYRGAESEWYERMKKMYIANDQLGKPAEDVRLHIKNNAGKKFRGHRVDGSSGSHAVNPRIDYETRVRTGQWKYKPPASRPTGDAIAALQTAWHSTVQPYAMNRAWVNRKTGQHVRSILDRQRFIGGCMRYVTELFMNLVDPGVQESDWFNICYVQRVINAMLGEACKGKQGRWQWEGFYLDEDEFPQLSIQILQAYIGGSEDD